MEDGSTANRLSDALAGAAASHGTDPDRRLTGREFETLLERGRAAHPTLPVSADVFERFLAAAIKDEPGTKLDALAIEDLYLACACVDGLDGAAAVFEARYCFAVRRGVARALPAAADRDEAAQRTMRMLLVPERGAPAKLASYRGRGALQDWITVTAIRVAVSFARSERIESRLRQRAADEAMAVADPELLAMKGELKKQIEDATRAALDRLDQRLRMVLRFYLVSGMTLAAIGKIFGVKQPTVSRWLARAREAIMSDIQCQLGSQPGLARAELVSMVRLVGSQLNVSISRLLDSR